VNCPKCNSDDSSVIDSRERYGGRAIRRRRECKACGERWSSTEAPDEVFRELLDIASVYFGIAESCATASSTSAGMARQFFRQT
jgi:transcriptional regulator NrdR family protein